MDISYDYEDSIQLIKSEIKEGFLNHSDTIQVLRGPERYGYFPIVSWYYAKEKMKGLPDFTGGYDSVKGDLEEMRVDEALEEMERLNKLFPHWIEELLNDFGIKSRYQLERLGGPKQSATANMISRNTEFKDISIDTLLKLVDAIVNHNPDIDKDVLLIGLIRDYA